MGSQIVFGDFIVAIENETFNKMLQIKKRL